MLANVYTPQEIITRYLQLLQLLAVRCRKRQRKEVDKYLTGNTVGDFFDLLVLSSFFFFFKNYSTVSFFLVFSSDYNGKHDC